MEPTATTSAPIDIGSAVTACTNRSGATERGHVIGWGTKYAYVEMHSGKVYRIRPNALQSDAGSTRRDIGAESAAKRDALRIGAQAAFTTKNGQRIQGTVTELSETAVRIESGERAGRILLAMINAIDDHTAGTHQTPAATRPAPRPAPPQPRPGMTARSDLRIGQRVTFAHGRRGPIEGTIVRLPLKRAVIDTANGEWRVPYARVTATAGPTGPA